MGLHSNQWNLVQNRNPICLPRKVAPSVNYLREVEGPEQEHRYLEEAFMCLFPPPPPPAVCHREQPWAHFLSLLSMGSSEGRLKGDTFLSASCSAASPSGCPFLHEPGS